MDLAPGPGDPAIPVVIVAAGSSSELIPDLGALQLAIDESLRPASTALEGTATVRVDMALNPYTARNVVALVEGSDPELRGEAIVVGAHYDHDGAVGDRIWNGADDNASGTSALLELAEAFSSGMRPARSVILAAWAAEEKGMVGSRAYVRDPPIPLDDTVAMFQIDMIGRNEEHGANPAEGFDEERASENGNALNMIGSVFSPDLRRAFESSNEEVGLDLAFRYDYGAQNLLRRSDHWSFLSRSVPAIFLFGGLHPDYHTPNDTAEKINYDKIQKVVRLVYRTLEEIGGASGRPEFVDPPDRN
jgi:Zn-dependent M28 family amino/carboxypeptidase